MRSLFRVILTLATTAGLAAPLAASATYLSAGPGAGPSSSPTPAAVTVDTVVIDISGIQSFEPFGNALNERIETLLPGFARITGIGWDTTQFADTPSFLAQMSISFESSALFAVQLRPGVGDDFSGTKSYTSGGIVDLVGLGLDFELEADGRLLMEFFETFNDFANDWDGEYRAGSTISVRYEYGSTTPVPAPASLALAGLALLALTLSRRRRA